LTEQFETQFPGAAPRVRFWEVQRQIMNVLIGGLVRGTTAAAEMAGVENVADVRALPYRLASLTPEALDINKQIRALLVSRVYAYPQLVEERGAAAAKVGELFAYLVKHPDQLSPGYREQLGEAPVHRIVCDYLAGMTDAYFTRTYKALVG
jgi:dGTPase